MRDKNNKFLKDLEYFYKKNILLPFLNKSKKRVENSLFDLKIIDNTNKFINKKIIKTTNEVHILDFKKKIGAIKEFLKPAKKELWIKEFKNFLMMFILVLFFLEMFMAGINVVDDLKNFKINTTYAKNMFENGVNDLKNSRIKNAKNRFYLGFDSLYKIGEKTSFITDLSVSIYSSFINFSKNNLNETIRYFDNISIASTKLASNLEKFKDNNNLYKAKEIRNAFSIITSNIEKINVKINKIKYSFLPKQYQDEFLLYKDKLIELEKISKDIYLSSDIISYIIGEKSDTRILFIFENANELRATGGFMGSYALIDFKNGDIKNYEIPGGGIYDLRAGFTKSLKPPEPFKTLVKKWEIQDANWFFDFEKSANKIIEFFEPSSKTSVDGVIVINSNMMEGLMNIVGDITLEENNVIFTKENIIDEMQTIISAKRNKTSQPKVIIGKLFEKISDQLLNKKDFELEKLYELFNDIKDKKQILAYFKDYKTQNNIYNIGLSGNIININDKEDYLSIVETNIGGGKTSQYIDRKVDQNINILETGEIIKTLVINKKYKKQNNDFDEKNIEFMRIYAPLGSELISVYGFDDIKTNNIIYTNYEDDKDLKNLNELSIRDFNTNTIIYNDEGKTIFGNFLYLNPGEEKQVVIKYKLPFRLELGDVQEANYKIYLQKQSGVENFNYKTSIKIDNYSVFMNNKNTDNNEIFLDKDYEIDFKLIKK